MIWWKVRRQTALASIFSIAQDENFGILEIRDIPFLKFRVFVALLPAGL